MNALDLLIADHNRVRGLFARFNDAKDAGDTARMIELAGAIFDDLTVHTAIEEEIFYPEVAARDEIAELVDEGVQEHHVVKVLMEELGEVEPASDEWIAKMAVMIENVEHHAEEEEQEMFPSVRSRFEADRLRELGDRLDGRKAELGAPVLADKIDLSKAQLLDLAREQAIPGRSTMSQEELAATVAPA